MRDLSVAIRNHNHTGSYAMTSGSHNDCPSSLFTMVVFAGTYMPPTHLLALPASGRISVNYSSSSMQCPHIEGFVSTVDRAGDSAEAVAAVLRSLVDPSQYPPSSCSRVLLACPIPLWRQLEGHVLGNTFPSIAEYGPHLSMEQPPRVSSIGAFMHDLRLTVRESFVCHN
eukprot:Opistho-2@59455